MQVTSIIALLFLLPFAAIAGTFLETFDDSDLERWQELVVLNNAPGSWEIINDELHGVSHAGFLRLLTTSDDTWEDYTFEFEVKPLKKHGRGGIAIAARVKGSVLFYCSLADPVILGNKDPLLGSFLSCMKGDLHDAEFTVLYFESHPLLKLNKWSRLKLSVKGTNFIFSLNGKEIAETGDDFALMHNGKKIKTKAGKLTSFRTGGVGFGLWNYTALFDNITVTGDSIPNGGGFAVTPNGKLATTWGQLKKF
ncbi:MAG: DUF1080 domain-containing protein [Candidatus Poribacteria bacterium]|nr:DUF1080 domain-containing protein [Candidatus Poribacteria bacterium]